MSQNWNTSVRKEGQKIPQTMNERLLASHKKHLQAVALAKELLLGTSYASYHCRPFSSRSPFGHKRPNYLAYMHFCLKYNQVSPVTQFFCLAAYIKYDYIVI